MDNIEEKYRLLARTSNERLKQLILAERLMKVPIFVMFIAVPVWFVARQYDFFIFVFIITLFGICYPLSFYIGVIKKTPPVKANQNERSAILTYEAYSAVDRILKNK